MEIFDLARALIIDTSPEVRLNFDSLALACANFAGRGLEGANFDDADLSGASFQGADLYWSRFYRAKCTGAKFRSASLQGAVLDAADCSHADFTGAFLGRDNLKGSTSLHGTILRGAILTGADLTGAEYTSETQVPRWLRPAACKYGSGCLTNQNRGTIDPSGPGPDIEPGSPCRYRLLAPRKKPHRAMPTHHLKCSWPDTSPQPTSL